MILSHESGSFPLRQSLQSHEMAHCKLYSDFSQYSLIGEVVRATELYHQPYHPDAPYFNGSSFKAENKEK